MVETTTGLVLRTRPLTETSLIVHWLTADLGRLATVAKGALRPKSPFRGKLDLFYSADFSFTRSRRSDLHTLSEVSLLDTRRGLRQDLRRLEQAAYFAALIEQTTETETPLPGVFTLFAGALDWLASSEPRPRMVFAFELKLLDELGLGPDLEKTKLAPKTRDLVQALGESDWVAIGRLKPSPESVLELRQYLHGFLIYHLEKIPRGRTEALRGS
jgi:DNA repair protein RecO (recombination protein O)